MSSTIFDKPVSSEMASLKDVVDGKAIKSVSMTLTATAAGWSNAIPPTQVIAAVGVTSTNNICVGEGSSLTENQRNAILAAQLACTAQSTGTITLTCYGTKPTIDIPISVMVLG